jgi:LPXTG-motif cell wall-anchored protein
MPDLSQKPDDPMSKWRLASLASEMGFIIALPLLVFTLLGKKLDLRFGTTPWLTLAGIVLAISSTTLWLTRRFRELIK